MMTKCIACQKEMAKGVRKCPQCGKDQRNFFMGHKIISVIVILAIIGVIGNVEKFSNRITLTVASKTTTSAPVAVKAMPVVPVVQNIKISAIGLENAYDNNAVKADNLYKNKELEINGTVSSISTILGQTAVNIQTNSSGILTIGCYFTNKAEIAKVANLNKGDNVKILGNCDGKSIEVTMSKCSMK